MTNEEITAARALAFKAVQIGNPYLHRQSDERVVPGDVMIGVGGQAFVSFHQIGHRDAKQIVSLDQFTADYRLAIGEPQTRMRLKRRAG